MKIIRNALFVAVVVSTSLSQAKELSVENFGEDSQGCGRAEDPCRSISQAVFNAAPGDRILVGPGIYGDIDKSLYFDVPGDESADHLGCGCMIRVDKPLTITSREGAQATVIDAVYPLLGQMTAVSIESSGVTFGKKGKGFHITSRGGRNSSRLLSGLSVADHTAAVTVEGNMVSTAVWGFHIRGENHLVTGNRAINNRNSGFRIGGDGHEISGNAAIDSIGVGLSVAGIGHQVIENEVVGNGSCGIKISGWPTDNIVVNTNNIYGNGGASATWWVNCGLQNDGGFGDRVDLSNNFWGSSGGPGPDPADFVLNSSDTPVLLDDFALDAFSLLSQVF